MIHAFTIYFGRVVSTCVRVADRTSALLTRSYIQNKAKRVPFIEMNGEAGGFSARVPSVAQRAETPRHLCKSVLPSRQTLHRGNFDAFGVSSDGAETSRSCFK